MTDLATPPCDLDTDLPAKGRRVVVRTRPGVAVRTSHRRGVLVLFDDRAFGEWFPPHMVDEAGEPS